MSPELLVPFRRFGKPKSSISARFSGFLTARNSDRQPPNQLPSGAGGRYVDEALRGSESDLLFSAKVSGKSAFLYLLFEHQSRPDPLMPLRILGYMLRILDVHVTSAESPIRALPLPLVVPVLLHHGEGGWSAARRLEDLFDSELVAEAGLHDFIPRLSFVLDDLSGLSDEALEARQLALEPLLALWALRDARSRSRLESAIEHWVRINRPRWFGWQIRKRFGAINQQVGFSWFSDGCLGHRRSANGRGGRFRGIERRIG